MLRPLDEALGVPLHADVEAGARVLEPLDDAVLRPGREPEVAAEALGRLVVEGVDVERGAAGERAQARVAADAHPVRGVVAGLGLAMAGQMLDQGPAGGDVHDLHPAADAEDRHPAGGRAAGEHELERVGLGLGRAELGRGLGAVGRRGGGPGRPRGTARRGGRAARRSRGSGQGARITGRPPACATASA